MRKTVILMLGFVLLAAGFVFAQQAPASKSIPSTSSKLVDVGNKVCPVSGNTIGVMGPGIQHVYKGKIYHLCCPGCIASFDSDPEKYSKIAEK